MSSRLGTFLSAVLCCAASGGLAHAVPYASRISIGVPNALMAENEGGPIVSFTLNEPADKLGYRINGGPMQWLDGSTSGVKNFPILSALDQFTILAKKSEAVGYTIPTGETSQPTSNGLTQPVPLAGLKLISDDANRWMMFNGPRGIGVNTNPNSPNFGVAYVANAANGNTSNGERLLNRGVYTIAPDGYDAFGYGDFAPDPNLLFAGLGTTMRVEVGDDGEVYVADSSSTGNGLVRLDGQLWSGWPVLQPNFGLPSIPPVPPGVNRGRIAGFAVEGSPYDGTLVIHTIDRDLTSSHFGGDATDDFYSLWRYDLGYDAQWSMQTPTKVNDSVVLPGLPTNADLARGADGKFYLSNSSRRRCWTRCPRSSGCNHLRLTDGNSRTIERSLGRRRAAQRHGHRSLARSAMAGSHVAQRQRRAAAPGRWHPGPVGDHARQHGDGESARTRRGIRRCGQPALHRRRAEQLPHHLPRGDDVRHDQLERAVVQL